MLDMLGRLGFFSSSLENERLKREGIQCYSREDDIVSPLFLSTTYSSVIVRSFYIHVTINDEGGLSIIYYPWTSIRSSRNASAATVLHNDPSFSTRNGTETQLLHSKR